MFSINAVFKILLQIPLTTLLDRWEAQHGAAIGLGLFAAGCALLPFGGGFGFAIALVLIGTIGEIVFAPAQMSIVMQRADKGDSGKYLGIHHSLSRCDLGRTFGGAVVYQTLGGEALWLGSGGLGIFATALMWRLKP